jgi:hypothetical protein
MSAPGQRDKLFFLATSSIVGNHELNAIAYLSPNADRPGEFLRRHSDKNKKQHEKFLAEYEGADEFVAIEALLKGKEIEMPNGQAWQ